MVGDAANAGANQTAPAPPKSKLDEFIERERAKLTGEGHPVPPPADAKRPLGGRKPKVVMVDGSPEKEVKLPIPAEIKEALKVMIRSVNPKHKITEADVVKANDALEGVMMYWVDVRFVGDAKYMPEVGLGLGVVGMVVTEVRAQRNPVIMKARAEREAKEAAEMEAALKKDVG